MIKTKSSHLLGLLFLLVISVLPCRALADPTPVSNLSQDDAALEFKINNLYVNYKALGLRKFKCQIKISLFEKMLAMVNSQTKKDPSKYNAVKDIKFYMNYDEKDGMKLDYTNYHPTGDAKYDDSVVKYLGGMQQMISGYWDSWSGVTFEPAIDPSQAEVIVKKTADGFEIAETKDSVTSINIFNPDLLMGECDVQKKDSLETAAVVKPRFFQTPEGWLVNSLAIIFPRTMNETITLKYQEVSKYLLPSQAVIAMEMQEGKKAGFTLEFSGYQIN